MPARESHISFSAYEGSSSSMTESPSTSAIHLSPRQAPINPNLNPFAPLSPDLVPPSLYSNAVVEPPRGDRPFICYPRVKLLSIAKACSGQSWPRPAELGGLETWYGPPPAPKSPTQPMQDPAIVSIGQPSAGGQNTRRGGGLPSGFGEGFGFGGGIGGASRALSRGGRQTHRRQPEAPGTHAEDSHDTIKGPSTRFERPKGAEDVSVYQGEADKPRGDRRFRRDEADWRRNDRSSVAPPTRRDFGDNGTQPAWMDDGPAAEIDPAIVTPSVSDPLIKFTPGEDMIAAHKRNMRARDTATAWRGEKSLVSFLGSETPVASHDKQAAPARDFNAERYLLPKKQEHESLETTSSTTSRFQRFFSPPASTAISNETTSEEMAPPPTSARMSLLMNALRTPTNLERPTMSTADRPPIHPQFMRDPPFNASFHRYDVERPSGAQSEQPAVLGYPHRSFAGQPPSRPPFQPPWDHNSHQNNGEFKFQHMGAVPNEPFLAFDAMTRNARERAPIPHSDLRLHDKHIVSDTSPQYLYEAPPAQHHIAYAPYSQTGNAPNQPPRPIRSFTQGEPNKQTQKLLDTLFAEVDRQHER